MVYSLRSLVGHADCTTGPDAKGRWSRAVPLQFYGGYLQGAWAVLTGKAIAVRYPEAGELEQALQDTGGIHVPSVPDQET